MASSTRKTSGVRKTSTRTKTVRKKAAAKAKTRARTPAGRATRPTLASISAQVEALTALVAAMADRLGIRSEAQEGEAPAPKTKASAEPNAERFETDLLDVIAQIDRSGRHTGMVPVPDVRNAFLDRGWKRREFDQKLLQAERDFVVDLKTADDPSRLVDPRLAIEQPGRGHLQYVVIR